MISLNWIKSLTNFYWLETSLCQNCIYNSQDLLIALAAEDLLRIVKEFRKIGNLKYLYRNELDNSCFAYDAANCDRKDLAERIISDKILKDIANKIAKSYKYDGHQSALASMLYSFFDNKTGSRVSLNQQLTEKLHKPVTKNSKEEESLQDLKIIFGQ